MKIRATIARCPRVARPCITALPSLLLAMAGACTGDDGGGSETMASETEASTTTATEASTTTDTEASTTTDTETTTSTTSDVDSAPEKPVLELGLSQVKQFDFSWTPALGAEYYRLLEQNVGDADYDQVGEDIVGTSTSLIVPVLLHQRLGSTYVVEACNQWGCTQSAAVEVVGSLAEAIGYVKASNTGEYDHFGNSVALSGDGSTLAVGASSESSSATGIGSDQDDNSSSNAGAVYVFVRDDLGIWTQQAYVKASNKVGRFGESVALSADGSTLAVGSFGVSQAGAAYVFVRDDLAIWTQQAYLQGSNTEAKDYFGTSVALSGDGSTLAVGAYMEDSNATGINGDQADNSASGAGAVYMFVRDDLETWTQQAYIKASNTDKDDGFGWSVALSGDGTTLAVGAWSEASSATGIDGNQADNSAAAAGAAYVFVRDDLEIWTQQAYVKASNTDATDYFGSSVALSGDGSTLAVGAYKESGGATGINGNQANDVYSVTSGAVYVFVRDGLEIWTQQAYVKASNTDAADNFGISVALSGDGSTLAVGASGEASIATGIDGKQGNGFNTAGFGAVFVFERDGLDVWTQGAYVKASNTGSDLFGFSVALSGDSSTLAVGADGESSNATGIAGNQADNSASGAGAVYLY